MSCVKHEAETRSMHIAHTARYKPGRIILCYAWRKSNLMLLLIPDVVHLR